MRNMREYDPLKTSEVHCTKYSELGSANLQRESGPEFASLSTFLSYVRHRQVLIRTGKAPAGPSDICFI